jgi:hypothetical protein
MLILRALWVLYDTILKEDSFRSKTIDQYFYGGYTWVSFAALKQS